MRNANKNVIPQTNTVTDAGVTYTAHNDVFTQGAGYLDIAAAVDTTRRRARHPLGTAHVAARGRSIRSPARCRW